MKEKAGSSDSRSRNHQAGNLGAGRSLPEYFQFNDVPQITCTNDENLLDSRIECNSNFEYELSERTWTNEYTSGAYAIGRAGRPFDNTPAELEAHRQKGKNIEFSRQQNEKNDITAHNERSIILCIAQGVLRASKSDKNERIVHLAPSEFGNVSIKIFVEGAVTKARIIVESQKVRKILQKRFKTLKESLQKHKVRITCFEVLVSQHREMETGAGKG